MFRNVHALLLRKRKKRKKQIVDNEVNSIGNKRARKPSYLRRYDLKEYGLLGSKAVNVFISEATPQYHGDEVVAIQSSTHPQFSILRAIWDCHDTTGEQERCVVAAISNYTTQLLSYGDSSNEYNLTESLMFLAHFIGDIHQPLHAGFEEDRGGNSILVNWYQTRTNLHHIWDSDILETVMEDFYNNDVATMIQAIEMNITEHQLKTQVAALQENS
ncbi:endonuclease 2 [Canna indica]|uniref:Aspergillus nuclease S1 n=1 Tax=Canna indica TaxID=4628 RepID=A0AAQ3JQS8_9LILI|nr:endonuclease 2 [Canna indica]